MTTRACWPPAAAVVRCPCGAGPVWCGSTQPRRRRKPEPAENERVGQRHRHWWAAPVEQAPSSAMPQLDVYDLLTIRFIDQRKSIVQRSAPSGRCSSNLQGLLETVVCRDLWSWSTKWRRQSEQELFDDSRFPRPQLWQFVIWARQACIFFLTCSLEVCLDVLVPSDSSTLDIGDAIAMSANLLSIHVVLIILALSFFASWHVEAWPYRVTFHNALEMLLCTLHPHSLIADMTERA